MLNSWSSCSVQHTFAIPALGLSVPIASPLNPNLCGTSPCTSGPHTVTFQLQDAKQGGVLVWQCRVPCGGGFVDGNGGPMSTIGYMAGNMQVVA